ncbi:Methenyltetrahydrofolate synthase domain-containing protein [Camelus dromedarius]|uniref:Methenyltetrahydrofolate synthase domain-containing protein n=1 Tax=Camelus dromedarius TaxID=9838 RepID=A0A5N4CPK6_CAMDR|nr:Methenyltetrahydrofolate synthase domain-containing protein [Camelus dromedarius]
MEPREVTPFIAIGVSKQDIREQIWDYMESQNLADFPRPVHHRIPNFKAFKMARTIKVNPDAPQKNARFFVLDGGHSAGELSGRVSVPPQGVRNYSAPVGLDSRVLVDLVVVGSVAVSEKGWRIGKGEGYADLEYAMMVSMGAVGPGTPVVTIVHDCQVVNIPETLLEDHDLTVDYILTPTRVITTGCERPKPTGITWSKDFTSVIGKCLKAFSSAMISWEMLGKIPILRSLRCREEQAGKDVTLRDEPRHLLATPSIVRKPRGPPLPELGSGQVEDVPSNTVYVGNLPRDARVSELKTALGVLGAAPLRLTWQGPQRRAFLHYRDAASAQRALFCLQGFHLGANALKVARARQQRTSDLVGGRAEEPHPDHRPSVADP